MEIQIDPDIRKAETLPGWFYSDGKLFLDLKTKVFFRSWQWISSIQAVRQPGDSFPFLLMPGYLNEPLLLTRDNEGKVHCLSNVCTHRGNILINARGNYPVLRCGYHGRRFSLEGKCEFMPGFEEVENFPCEKDHLREIPLSALGPLVFTSLAPLFSSKEVFSPIHERLGWLPWKDFLLDSTRCKEYEINANWALYIDNYLEGFHIPFVHGQSLAPALQPGTYKTQLFPHGTLQMAEAREGTPCFDLPADSPDAGKRIAAYYFWVYPNTMLNFYPWGLSLNIVRPVAPDKTQISFLTYVWRPELLESGAGKDLDRVEMEDEKIVENVQRGTGARLYNRGRYSPAEELGVHHFHRMLAAQLA